VALSACGAAPNSIDVSGYPPDMQARYDLFERRCTRCHELERPLNARVGEGGWGKYVQRMARHPAAGISAQEQREIAIFLEYHAERRRTDAQAQAPASAGGAP
jgi:cytochrome c2